MGMRNIIEIDEAKCNGCGKCVTSCAEGAIRIVDGKARLISDTYCDGLGACLGDCPTDAIRIVQREAPAFDEAAVQHHLQQQRQAPQPAPHAGGCPGSRMQQLTRPAPAADTDAQPSQLATWPVQLHLVPPQAPYLQGADILIAADCVPVAYADFHSHLLRGRPVLIGCPKLDDAQLYVDKLTEILQVAAPRSLTVAYMQVPCCMGIARIAQLACLRAESELQPRTVVIGVNGTLIHDSGTTTEQRLTSAS